MTTKSSRVGSLSRRHALGVLVAGITVQQLGTTGTATPDQVLAADVLSVGGRRQPDWSTS